MKRLSMAVFFWSVLSALPALADRPLGQQVGPESNISPGEVRATPEMWFYEQYRREYQDPKLAVRRNAEYRAAQRQHRLAALKWFGFSNQRPRASSDPFNGDWSPAWSSNNPVYPYRWTGVGWPWTVGPSWIVWPGGYAVPTY